MKQLLTLKINLVVMAAYVVMLMIPELLVLEDLHWWTPYISVPFNLLVYTMLSWVCCTLFAMTGRKANAIAHIALHALVACYVLSDIFLYVFFCRHWDVYTVQFLRETNGREASEFVNNFVFSFRTLLMVVLAAGFFGLEWWLSRKVKLISAWPKRWMFRIAWSACLAMVAVHAAYFSPNVDRNYKFAQKYPSPIKFNDLWQTMQSILMYKQQEQDYERCATSLANYKEQPVCRDSTADFVLIIGESFNRHMSNLYDGRWNTNPRLKARQKQGRLFLFDDVTATSNGTSVVFRYLLSMNSRRDRKAWHDGPMLPLIMRRCGWNVTFYGNQFVVSDQLDENDAAMGFLNIPSVAKALFDNRNHCTSRYDLGLVADYAAQRKQLETKQRNFVIFHLYGQHMPAKERYPKKFAKFTPNNINRPELNNAQRNDVAHYLNATLYNDMVVDSIIRMFDNRNAVVMYLSDHGEEVHNFRNQYGRTDINKACRESYGPQFDIPFMIYLTPKYAKEHPELAARLKAARQRRFSNDDTPQVICDILGVQSAYVRKQHSLINDSYIAPLHRLITKDKYYD